MGGAHKNAKVHKTPPEYRIMKDDAKTVAQMVQDRIVEDFDNAQRQRDKIEDDLEYM
jgi:hypothetical protein